jgi:hypothetical protein
VTVRRLWSPPHVRGSLPIRAWRSRGNSPPFLLLPRGRPTTALIGPPPHQQHHRSWPPSSSPIMIQAGEEHSPQRPLRVVPFQAQAVGQRSRSELITGHLSVHEGLTIDNHLSSSSGHVAASGSFPMLHRSSTAEPHHRKLRVRSYHSHSSSVETHCHRPPRTVSPHLC